MDSKKEEGSYFLEMDSNNEELVRPSNEENLAAICGIPITVSRNAIELFEQNFSVPFICRYRQIAIKSMKAEELRKVQAAYKEMKQVRRRVHNILKSEVIDENLVFAFLNAKTLAEFEFLAASCKQNTSMLLKAKECGLDEIARNILQCKKRLVEINFSALVNKEKGLKNTNEVTFGSQHCIADEIAKNREVLDFLQQRLNDSEIKINSTESGDAKNLDDSKKIAYSSYFSFSQSIKNVLPYQIMAINRGEKQKILKTKIEIPDEIKKKIIQFIWNKFCFKKLDQQTTIFLQKSIKEAWKLVIAPLLYQQIRLDLTRKAETECISVFSANVRSVLLTPPLRGKTVIGIDPGFTNGCKLAVVSSKGEVLATDTLYPTIKKDFKAGLISAQKLRLMIFSFRADIIALGNGIGCRETELWLSKYIGSGFFQPFDLKYCILNEAGASVYSISSLAEEELPNMDPKLRGAVSLARRLQDPLFEYSKIDARYMGIGMYQHDLPEDKLTEALNNVVEECVCAVGVDLNVCPEFLLGKIPGLDSTLATKIVNFRKEYGAFVNRKQLLDVSGMEEKAFVQSAGFLKILPKTCVPKHPWKHMLNPLDRTIIHPESYKVAERFLAELNASKEEIGKQVLVDKVNKYMLFKCTEDVAKHLEVSVPTAQLIIGAFKELSDKDIRGDFQPIFARTVTAYSDLEAGQILPGVVVNFTPFGAFVDIGVEKQGLVYNNKMNNQVLKVCDKVDVKILHVETAKKRIGLELLRKH